MLTSQFDYPALKFTESFSKFGISILLETDTWHSSQFQISDATKKIETVVIVGGRGGRRNGECIREKVITNAINQPTFYCFLISSSRNDDDDVDQSKKQRRNKNPLLPSAHDINVRVRNRVCACNASSSVYTSPRPTTVNSKSMDMARKQIPSWQHSSTDPCLSSNTFFFPRPEIPVR